MYSLVSWRASKPNDRIPCFVLTDWLASFALVDRWKMTLLNKEPHQNLENSILKNPLFLWWMRATQLRSSHNKRLKDEIFLMKYDWIKSKMLRHRTEKMCGQSVRMRDTSLSSNKMGAAKYSALENAYILRCDDSLFVLSELLSLTKWAHESRNHKMKSEKKCTKRKAEAKAKDERHPNWKMLCEAHWPLERVWLFVCSAFLFFLVCCFSMGTENFYDWIVSKRD